MQAIGIDEETVYLTNKYGLTEPKNGEIINPKEIDLVIVPMLICDKEGFRVGYGKGFYDKFLSQCSDKVVTIGFNYFEPIDEIENTDEYDIPLCCCITPTEIYEF
jgi:5-formyltetrahydrofolate cyclo-ligase